MTRICCYWVLTVFSSSFDRSGCVKKSLYGLGLTKAWWIWPFVFFAIKVRKMSSFYSVVILPSILVLPGKADFVSCWVEWLPTWACIFYPGMPTFFFRFLLPKTLIYCASVSSELMFLSWKKIFLISCHNKQRFNLQICLGLS